MSSPLRFTSSALSALICTALLLSLGRPALSEDEPVAKPPAFETKLITYNHGDVVLEGYLARPTAPGTDAPGVLLCHAWKGRGTQVKAMAETMAARGYIAFALDMYGKGVHAEDNGEARALATPFYADPPLMRGRARAGLGVLLAQEGLDKARVLAQGFCFGGTTVLELARDGAPLAGAVSYHGGLKTLAPAEAGAIKAKLLICHGGDDPYVPMDQVQAFWTEMRDAGADYQILILSDAVHSFTDKRAGDDPSRGAAYNAVAAARAFAATDGLIKTLWGE